MIARYGSSDDAKSDNSLGRICRGLAGAYNVALAKVVPLDGVSREFLYYLLQSRHFQEPLRAQGARSVQAGFNRESLGVIALPIPPIAEQLSIARVLGSLDDRIELNQRVSQTLESMARALFKSWFIDFDPVRAKSQNRDWGLPEPLAAELPASFEESSGGMGPTGWRWVRFGDVLVLVKGRLPQAAETAQPSEQRPVILISTLDSGESAIASARGAVEASPEDTLMVMDGASSGRVECGFAGLVGSTLAKVVGLSSEPGPRFWYYTLKHLEPEIRQHLTGTSIPHADKGWILRQNVCVPPTVALLDAFERIASRLRERIDLTRAECRALSDLRDRLLPELLAGELRARDIVRFGAS